MRKWNNLFVYIDYLSNIQWGFKYTYFKQDIMYKKKMKLIKYLKNEINGSNRM